MEKRSKEGMKAKYDYITRYNKENYQFFTAQLRKEEYKELKELLQKKRLGNAEFIRYAYEKLLSGQI